ncbi:hypothetical protein L486_08533 [Kwoniella mangroviensis CBS 10435]|uniref:Aquaporin n=1 Tax=Kwoniella mangroviensis CBS 10435 TaxID=1331196 RepID=A0A1B9IEI8_9TREE|nr:hypothetical protein L486_08533 [Kwoniella mangroviensis CBS 10435]
MNGSSRSAGPGTVTSLPQDSPVAEGPPAAVEVRGLWYKLRHPSPVGCWEHLHVTLLGEFAGTFLFLFFAYAGVMAINVWIFFRVSGGLFNPAVTAAFMLCGLTHPIRGVFIIITQLIAGICAAAVVDALTPGPLSVDNALGPNVSVSQGLFMEMFLTAELILAIFMLTVEKHRGTSLAQLGIGIALFMGHMVGIYYTGAGLNPARSLGPAVVEKTFPGYHWIYCEYAEHIFSAPQSLTNSVGIGPFLGSLLASFFYKTLRVFEYYTANEGQDDDGLSQKLA